jgi:TolA-binding protein
LSENSDLRSADFKLVKVEIIFVFFSILVLLVGGNALMMSYSQPQKVPSQENQTLSELQQEQIVSQIEQKMRQQEQILSQFEQQMRQQENQTQQQQPEEIRGEEEELKYELQQFQEQKQQPQQEQQPQLEEQEEGDDDVPSFKHMWRILNQSALGLATEYQTSQAANNATPPLAVFLNPPPSSQPLPDNAAPIYAGCRPDLPILPQWTHVKPGFNIVQAEGIISSSKHTVVHHDWPFNHKSHDNNFKVTLDKDYTGLASVNHPKNEDGLRKMGMEWEIGTANTGITDRFPKLLWPWEGDRVWMLGHWVWDCGHFDPVHLNGWKSEIHAPFATAFARNEPYQFPGDNSPSSATVTYIYLHGRGGGGNFNTPVGGQNYEFDIPMPPKPSNLPTVQLRSSIIGLPFGGPAPILTPNLQENKAHVVLPLSGIPASSGLKYGAIVAAKWFDPIGGPLPTERFVTLKVIFDSIFINQDHDGPQLSGEWDNFWVGVNGKWIELSGPSGHHGLDSVDSGELIRFPTGSKSVTVTVSEKDELKLKTTGWEDDQDGYFGHSYAWFLALPWWNPFGPDKLGALNDNDKIGFVRAAYDATENFGIGPHNDSSVRDGPSDTNKDFTLNYRIEQLSSGKLSVLSPAAEQTHSTEFEVTPNNKLKINIMFDKPVVTSTVIPRSSLILQTEGSPNANVVLTWSNNNSVLTLVSVDNFQGGSGAVCRFDPDCGFKLTLDGAGTGVISATDGSFLNGGLKDYWTGFTIIG